MVIDDLIFYDYIITLSKNGNSRMMEGCLDIYYFDELFDISDTKTHQPGIIFTLRQVFCCLEGSGYWRDQ